MFVYEPNSNTTPFCFGIFLFLLYYIWNVLFLNHSTLNVLDCGHSTFFMLKNESYFDQTRNFWLFFRWFCNLSQVFDIFKMNQNFVKKTGLGLTIQFINGILNFSSLCAQYNSVKESKNEGGWVGLFVLQFLLFFNFKSECFEF